MKATKEKWFIVQKIECKNGIVDITQVDGLQNPNDNCTSQWVCNALKKWCRINTEWFLCRIPNEQIKQMTKQEIMDYEKTL